MITKAPALSIRADIKRHRASAARRREAGGGLRGGNELSPQRSQISRGGHEYVQLRSL